MILHAQLFSVLDNPINMDSSHMFPGESQLSSTLEESQLKVIDEVLSTQLHNPKAVKYLTTQLAIFAFGNSQKKILRYLANKDLQVDISVGIEMLEELFNSDHVDTEFLNIILLLVGAQNFKTCPEFFPFLKLFIEDDQTEILKWLAVNGAYPFSSSVENYRILFHFIATKDAEMVKFMLEKTCSKDFEDLESEVPNLLEVAVETKNFDIAKLLLEQGFRIDLRRNHVVRAMYRATQHNCTSMLQLLHPYVSPLKSSTFDDYFCNPPMIAACRLGHLKAAQFLLDAGVDINGICDFKNNWTPLHVGCFFYMGHRNLEFMEFLLRNGADVTKVDNDYETPLFKTVAYPELVELLVSYGADINAKNRLGFTPLHQATARSEAAVRTFLKLHADVEIRGPNGISVYHSAVKYGNNETLKLLLKHRSININKHVDSTDDTLVHYLRNVANIRNVVCKISNTLLFHRFELDQITKRETLNRFNPCECKPETCGEVDYFNKMSFLGVEFSKSDKKLSRLFRSKKNDTATLELYDSELQELKKIVIRWLPETTLCDVLTRNNNRMQQYARNQNLLQLYNECNGDFETKFPHFGVLLNIKLSEVLRRRTYVDQAIDMFETLIAFCLPDECGELIFSHFSISDLAVFDKIALTKSWPNHQNFYDLF